MFTLSHLGLIASKHTQNQEAKVSRILFVSLKNMGKVWFTYPRTYPKQLDPLHTIDFIVGILNDTGLFIRSLKKINLSIRTAYRTGVYHLFQQKAHYPSPPMRI